ncbi:MAG: type IV pilus prepilin peptidase PilD [uncultured bacterium]|nr:MAG: type IV pilus prepilin peptidase PilD [uncultured bacterium]
MDIIHFIAEHPDFFLFLVAALSLLIGSFLNVIIYRLPQMMKNEWSQECREYLGLKEFPSDIEKLNLYLPLSHCTHCKKRLKPWHNIPVLSYLVLRGKCAFCSAKISMRYPFVELICCITSVYVAWRFGFSPQTVGGLIFTWIAISLTFIDLDHHLLPDPLTLSLVWVGLFLSIFTIFTNSQDAILGAIAGYTIFAVVQGLFKFTTGKIGMGQGDYKFLAGLGAFLGWQQLPIIILLASLIGLIFGLTQMVLKHSFKSVPIPFGPYLAVAGWISLMWGPEILTIYTHQFLM